MKLVAAKCPNCGANLNVNPNSETTKCEYCQQTIFIETAISNYILEIPETGKDQYLPNYDNLLKLANRNYDNEEFEEAYKLYEQLLKMDADNSIVLLRYGICKTLLNNYIDFTMDYLISTFDNVVELLKQQNEYAEKIDSYISEVLNVNVISQNATVNYYNSYSINRFDLSQVQAKMLSCLKLFEKILEYASEDTRNEIIKLIISTIDSIVEDKVYKTGKGEYGGNVTKVFVIDKELKNMLENKRSMYMKFIFPDENNNHETIKSNNDNYYNKKGFIIAMICIIGLFSPIISIIILWTFGKNFEKKHKIIATAILMLYLLIVIFSN